MGTATINQNGDGFSFVPKLACFAVCKEAYWLNRKLTKVQKRPRQEVERRRFIRRIRPTERDELKEISTPSYGANKRESG
jgi:hypothetical protein